MGLVSSKLSARSIWVCSLSAGTVAIAAYYVYKKTAFSDDTVDSLDVNMAKRISGGYSDWQYAALGIPPPKRNNNYVIASTSTSTAQSPCSSLSSQSLGTGTSQVSSNYCPVYPTSRSIGNSEYNLAYDIEAAMKLEGVSLIDTHCHWDFIFGRIFLLQQERFTIKEFIRRYNHLFPMSYSGCIAVFCEPAKWLRFGIEDDALKDPYVWTTFGCHPHYADTFDSAAYLALKNLLRRDKVVALGEFGLDYSGKSSSDHPCQIHVFELQISLALEWNLPMCLHIRDADDEGLEILRKANVPKTHKIHLHCFNNDWFTCKKWLAEYPNLKIGLTPLITKPHITYLHKVVREVPLDRILLETDAPYFHPRLLPESYPLEFSHPGLVIHTAAQVASIKGVPIEVVIKANMRNVRDVYGIVLAGVDYEDDKPVFAGGDKARPEVIAQWIEVEDRQD